MTENNDAGLTTFLHLHLLCGATNHNQIGDKLQFSPIQGTDEGVSDPMSEIINIAVVL